jgi:hypothetical protein
VTFQGGFGFFYELTLKKGAIYTKVDLDDAYRELEDKAKAIIEQMGAAKERFMGLRKYGVGMQKDQRPADICQGFKYRR